MNADIAPQWRNWLAPHRPEPQEFAHNR